MVRPDKEAMSRDWFRPSPPLPSIKWGPRNNINIQESALLFSLEHVASNRDTVPRQLLAEKQTRRLRKDAAGPTFALGNSGRPGPAGPTPPMP